MKLEIELCAILALNLVEMMILKTIARRESEVMRYGESGILKFCVLLSFVLYTMYFLMPFIYPYFYSEEVLGYIFFSPVQPIFSTTNSFAWLMFVLHAIAALWIYKRVCFGKYMYLLIVVLDMLVASASGFSVHTPMDTPIITLVNMLDAVVIYIAFFQISKLEVDNVVPVSG